MSEDKSRLSVIVASCLGVLLVGGRLVKSCTKAAKGSKAIQAVDDLSGIRLSKEAVGSESINFIEGLSHLSDAKDLTNAFILPDQPATLNQINTLLSSSVLSGYLLNETQGELHIDSVHHFIDLNIYVPEVYSIKGTNNQNTVKFINRDEEIQLTKTFHISPNTKLGAWTDNKKGIRYKQGNAEFANSVLHYSYVLRTNKSLYKMEYKRKLSDKKDIPKHILKLEAFIQLLEEGKS